MFLPHTICITQRTVTIENGESRYEDCKYEWVKAMVYKKSRNSLNDTTQSRDTDENRYDVIIKKGINVSDWDIITPDLWNGPIWEYVVYNIDQNYSYKKALQNTFFTIKKK